jgi:hypothetical protein
MNELFLNHMLFLWHKNSLQYHDQSEYGAGRGIRTLGTFRSQAFLTIPGLRPTRLGDPGIKSC